MKFSSTALALAACLPLTVVGRKGFNIAAQNFGGGCKTEADWQRDFAGMKKLPGGFNQVRVYASSDCNTLERAVPAAIRTGVKLLAGVWATDHAHYELEKKALLKAVKAHGVDWLSAISVGSEDLYRGDIDPHALAHQIYDVRGMMTTVKGGRKVPVGHVDTYTEFIKDSNAVVLKACDFLGVDSYPYFQGKTIQDAKKTFYRTLRLTKKAVQKHKKGTPIWITETGWPIHGPPFKKAIASPRNAHAYWHKVMCGLFAKHSVFAYTLRDENAGSADPNFAVVDKNYKPLFQLRC